MPLHAFPSCSARTDGFNIFLGLRDGSHGRDGRVQELTTPNGHFDVRATVEHHLARATSTSAIFKPQHIVYPSEYRPIDPTRSMTALINGAPNAVLTPIQPAIRHLHGLPFLLPDIHSHAPPRSLAPRPLGQPAPSPWASATAPPDRLSQAVRADRVTGRRLRLSKHLGPERTMAGMPWSIRKRTTKAFGLAQIGAELEKMGVAKGQGVKAIERGEINVAGASSLVPQS